jgi:hypothetical protein
MTDIRVLSVASRFKTTKLALLAAALWSPVVLLGVASAGPRNAAPRPQAIASENTAKPSSNQGQAKRIKYKKDTKVDFEDELIEGGVKNPFSSMLNSRDGDNKTGFVRIRKEWHDQMIMSVNGLSQ